MENGIIVVSPPVGNTITASLKTPGGGDPNPDNPVIVDFLDTTGGYRRVNIVAPVSTTLPAGAACGAPSLQPFRGYWHLVDGTSPQLGFAVYAGPSQIVRPIDGDLINTAVPGNDPFTVYTPSAVGNMSSRIIGESVWEAGLTVAGQWSMATATKLWRPGMLLPLDIINSFQNTTPVSQFTINGAANQWYDTNISMALTLKSAANAVDIGWGGNGFTPVAGHQITVGVFRNGVIHVGLLGIAYSDGGSIITPVNGGPGWIDFPGAKSVSYIVRLLGDGGGNYSFSYGANVSGANGQPVLRAVEVVT